jgi:hypothetical protein
MKRTSAAWIDKPSARLELILLCHPQFLASGGDHKDLPASAPFVLQP